jgi:uncharacterized membrane protein YGL010W
MEIIGMKYNKKGIEYYAEVHTTKQNVITHVVGMPFTIYGILLWIPTLLWWWTAWKIQIGLYLLYLGHYIRIDFQTSLYFTIMYIPSIILSITNYVPGFYGFLKGFTISTASLVFQEYVGHYLGNDPPSRLEAIPNAIVYAIYFSVDSLKKLLKHL